MNYKPSSDYPGDLFQDITTRLRTTRGSEYAQDVMNEAADIIETTRTTIAEALAASHQKVLGVPTLKTVESILRRGAN